MEGKEGWSFVFSSLDDSRKGFLLPWHVKSAPIGVDKTFCDIERYLCCIYSFRIAVPTHHKPKAVSQVNVPYDFIDTVDVVDNQ